MRLERMPKEHAATMDSRKIGDSVAPTRAASAWPMRI